jgi:3-methyl-2-oxobutanoate hydroxymethyltransferase
MPTKRLFPADFSRFKGGTPMVWLTAYTAPMGALLEAHCDVLLVGDSLGMVQYGYASTLPVTLEQMVQHGKAVVEATRKACVVVDMPFGSYQTSKEQAFTNAARIMAGTGCQALKLEGGLWLAPTVAFLVERGIPIVAHLGLQPQAVNVVGGYKVQGKEGDSLLREAEAMQDAGACAVLLEMTWAPTAKAITQALRIPTIGIGAGAACDGQVLVTEDMLGMPSPYKPRFVKAYANVASVIDKAVADYAVEVRSRAFPSTQHSYGDVDAD